MTCSKGHRRQIMIACLLIHLDILLPIGQCWIIRNSVPSPRLPVVCTDYPEGLSTHTESYPLGMNWLGASSECRDGLRR